jgi:pyruvate formate lyase activating enzyme
VDLKAFNDKYYRDVVKGRLQPVLDALKIIKKSGIHLEIVYLVVPPLNDNPEEIRKMSVWIKENLGPDVPLHFSRFHPQYKMQDYPATPVSTVETLRRTAMDTGLKYVYVGNVPPGNEGENTYCPVCGRALIKRLGFQVTEYNIVSPGNCKFCGASVYGRF